jgi:hypothetical protein
LTTTNRYAAENIERTRDLFEQVLEHSPPEVAHFFYLMYADFEERHGLARRAMYVYERATKNVSNESRKMIFTIYIARARELFGVTKTREIYEKAIEMLETKHIPEMCLKYVAYFIFFFFSLYFSLFFFILFLFFMGFSFSHPRKNTIPQKTGINNSYFLTREI